jgi:hypothetical protein
MVCPLEFLRCYKGRHLFTCSLPDARKIAFHDNLLRGIPSAHQISSGRHLVKAASNAYNFSTLFLAWFVGRSVNRPTNILTTYLPTLQLTPQGKRISTIEDGEQIIIVPASLQAFSMNTS